MINLKIIKAAERFKAKRVDKAEKLFIEKDPGSKIEMTLSEFLKVSYLPDNVRDKIIDDKDSLDEEFIAKPALTQDEIDALMEPYGHYMPPYDQSQESIESTTCEFLTDVAYEALRAAHETGDQEIIDRVWGDISSGKYYYDNEE